MLMDIALIIVYMKYFVSFCNNKHNVNEMDSGSYFKFSMAFQLSFEQNDINLINYHVLMLTFLLQ